MTISALCLLAPCAQADTVIYQDDFSGSANTDLGGSTPDVSLSGSSWVTANSRGDAGAAQVFSANGTIDQDGPGSSHDAGALLPFAIEPNRIYTLEADFVNAQPNWIAVGFASSNNTLDGGNGRHSGTRANEFGGYAWALSRNNSGTDQELWRGIGTSPLSNVGGGDFVDPLASVNIRIVLDTTDTNALTAEYFFNGTSQGTATLPQNAFNDISFVGISSDGNTGNGTATISNFSLTSDTESAGDDDGPLSVFLLNGGSSVVDGRALLAPAFNGNVSRGGLFGRSMNAVAHQTSPLVTFGQFQYATWYQLSNDGRQENVMLGRRNLITGSGWETLDTGLNLINGDAADDDRQSGIQTQTVPWDNHNAINLGISGDGRVHIAYDHHSNPLNYLVSVAGGATTGDWTRTSVFGSQVIRDSLNPGDPTLNAVTYPRFATNHETGDLVATYRLGQSGAGDLHVANYDAVSGTWSAGREFIEGTDGVSYSDSIASSSSRNPYLNDINFGPGGSLHATFTWRETANGTANHDINYITSNDGGVTWLNDSGDFVGSPGNSVSISSSGIIIGSDTDFVSPGISDGSSAGSNPPIGLIDREQTLINQQGQAVDLQGGVHVLMWQREDPSTYSSDDNAFDSREAAYFHYFKDPLTSEWTQTQIPLTGVNGSPLQVGSRPKIAYDTAGNVFAVFVSPGIARTSNRNYLDPGSLVIAGATQAENYSDWEILYQDNNGGDLFEGEPIIDQERFLTDGVLSVLIQGTNDSQTARTISDLHVFDFAVAVGPTVTVAVNPGEVQRSMLLDLEVSFAGNVEIGDAAFSLIKRGSDGGEVPLSFSTSNLVGRTEATLSFTGDFTESSGSLVDGNYQLMIDGGSIVDSQGVNVDVDGDGSPGGVAFFGDVEADLFYRLYGDVNASRDVNVVDLLQFRQTFLLTTGDFDFIAAFDSNEDGIINVLDLLRFRQNFLKSLPFE